MPSRFRCSTILIPKNSPPRRSTILTVATIASIERRTTCASSNGGSNPASNPSAIVDVVLVESLAQPRLLERNHRPIHRRPREDNQGQRPGSPEPERQADVDDGQGQIHRIARPCVRAADDEARRLSGGMECRAPEHEPSRRGRGERTACDHEPPAHPAHPAYRHPRRPPWHEPIESDPDQKYQRELSRRRDDRQDRSAARCNDAVHAVRTTRPRMRPARRSSSDSCAVASALISIGAGLTLPSRARATSSRSSGSVPVKTPTMLMARIGKVASGTPIDPPNRPTTNIRPPLRSTDRPKPALLSEPTKSIAEKRPPVSASKLLRASGSAGSMTAEAPASSAACRFVASTSATTGPNP